MIIQLETESEVDASYQLSALINRCLLTGNRNLKRRLRGLWDNESWPRIVEKFQTEGSTWYVWYMSGVQTYMRRRHRWNLASI